MDLLVILVCDELRVVEEGVETEIEIVELHSKEDVSVDLAVADV